MSAPVTCGGPAAVLTTREQGSGWRCRCNVPGMPYASLTRRTCSLPRPVSSKYRLGAHRLRHLALSNTNRQASTGLLHRSTPSQSVKRPSVDPKSKQNSPVHVPDLPHERIQLARHERGLELLEEAKIHLGRQERIVSRDVGPVDHGLAVQR